MLVLEAVSQSYGESRTLWDVALRVPKGSITCLMGRNGVGKTTLLNSIMGLLKLDSGTIEFMGEDLTRRPAYARARLGIGYVPQGREIFSRLSVEENLRIGLHARADRSRDLPEFLFELFPVLKDMLRRRGGDLSGGQQQQLAIARALATDPKFLILDEPTEGIQPNIVTMIGEILVRLNGEFGMTILLVEQKLGFARRISTEFRIMEKGRLVAGAEIAGLSDELIQRYLAV